MPTLLYGGKAYNFDTTRTVILGREVQGITKIAFSSAREIAYNKGANGKNYNFSQGSETNEASVTLDISEVFGIMQAAGFKGKLMDIPAFDISVVVGDEDANMLFRFTLVGCKFTKQSYEFSNDKKDSYMEIPLAIQDVIGPVPF